MGKYSRLIVLALTFVMSSCVFPYHRSSYVPQPISSSVWSYKILGSSIYLHHLEGLEVRIYGGLGRNDGRPGIKVTIGVKLNNGLGQINFLDSRLFLPSVDRFISPGKVSEVLFIRTPVQNCLWGFCQEGFSRDTQEKSITSVINLSESYVKVEGAEGLDKIVNTSYHLLFEVDGKEIQNFILHLGAINFRGKIYNFPEIKYVFHQEWTVEGMP